MNEQDTGTVNVLLVDDQESQLLTYETVLATLSVNLFKARSGQEALQIALKHEIAVAIIDVVMPDFDGFELAGLLHGHPRTRNVAIIFISAIAQTDEQRLKGYDQGAVDYVTVPVVPEVLRAKVRVFVELHRKSRDLERLNAELERRVEERTAELAQSEARFRAMADNIPQLAWMARPDGWIFWYNKRWYDYTGTTLKDMEGWGWRQVHHPEHVDRVVARIQRAWDTGEPWEDTFPLRSQSGEYRWFLSRALPIRDEEGRVALWFGTNTDITEHLKDQEQLKLLASEVDHRSKNVLALVQAMVTMTRADSAKEFAEAVEGRIATLSRAHSILAESRWEGADLRRLAEEELAAHQSESAPRIDVCGSEIMLKPQAAQALAILLHELATNATKYGALSTELGRVSLEWRVASAGSFELLWVEKDGPPVLPPTRRGVGTGVVERAIRMHLGGQIEFDWRREGLVCRVNLPVDKLA